MKAKASTDVGSLLSLTSATVAEFNGPGGLARKHLLMQSYTRFFIIGFVLRLIDRSISDSRENYLPIARRFRF